MVSERRAERAQLILITAVVIAAFVLATIVLLNLLHESPEHGAEQDAVSIDTSERLSAQVYQDIHRYFLAHSASDDLPELNTPPTDPTEFQLPYAIDSDEFGDELGGLSGPYTRATAQSRASVTDLTSLEAQSDEGAIVWSNNSRLGATTPRAEPPTPGQFLDDAETLPRLYVDVNFGGDTAREISIELDGTTYLTLEHGGVSAHGGSDCDAVERSYEVDLVHGVGEIRSDDAYCSVDLDYPDSTFDVSVTGSGVEDVNWEYAISATNGVVNDTEYRQEDMYLELEGEEEEVANKDVWGADDVLVDPTVAVVYEDARISYQTTIDLYPEGGR